MAIAIPPQTTCSSCLRSRLATRLLFASVIWLSSLFAANQGSAAQNIYAVAGVPVDITAGTVIEAREQAIAQGQREGLKRLLQRLTIPDFYSRLPDVSTINMNPLVRSFGVEKEQLSADRYIAEVNATYDGEAVRRLLQGRDVPIILETSKPVLIVPARRIDGRLSLFDRNDPWVNAWSRNFNRNTLLDIVLPVGDLLDVTKLPANAQGAAVDAGLSALSERYNTSSAFLVVAEGDDVEGSIVTIDNGGAFNWAYGFASFSLTGGIDTLWDQAVAGSLRRLETPWKAERLVRFGNVEQMTLTAPLADLADWAHIQRALGVMPEVQNVDLEAFSQSQAVLRIQFVGGLSQLQRSLENRGLRLAEETGRWQLRRAGNPQAG